MRWAPWSLLVLICGGIVCMAVAGNEPGKTTSAGPAAKKTPPAKAVSGKSNPPPTEKSAAEVVEVLRKSAEGFAAAFNRQDAQAIANSFTPTGEMVTEEGTVLAGRTAIAEHYTRVFSEQPDAHLELRVESIRSLAADVAIEEGTVDVAVTPDADPETSQYVALHVRENGQWLVARARDYSAGSRLRSSSAHLSDLEFLVGDWIGEEEGLLSRTSCQWVDDRNFLLQQFTHRVSGLKGVRGSTRIGWDPLSRQIRSWTFDSEGGFSEGRWTRTADGWIVKSQGVTHLGHSSSMTIVLRKVDDQTLSWETRDRTEMGIVVPSPGEIIVKRRPPEPEE